MLFFEPLKPLFRRKSLLEIASAELGDAELQKLSAQTAQEYAEAAVAYNTARIARLKKFIAAQTKEAS